MYNNYMNILILLAIGWFILSIIQKNIKKRKEERQDKWWKEYYENIKKQDNVELKKDLENAMNNGDYTFVLWYRDGIPEPAIPIHDAVAYFNQNCALNEDDML